MPSAHHTAGTVYAVQLARLPNDVESVLIQVTQLSAGIFPLVDTRPYFAVGRDARLHPAPPASLVAMPIPILVHAEAAEVHRYEWITLVHPQVLHGAIYPFGVLDLLPWSGHIMQNRRPKGCVICTEPVRQFHHLWYILEVLRSNQKSHSNGRIPLCFRQHFDTITNA